MMSSETSSLSPSLDRKDDSLVEKPTIVLVHGAFADASSWVHVIAILQRRGYRVEAVQNDLRSLAGDVAHTRARIAAQPGKVLLVGHSYGGAVISGAGAENDKVVGLVYLAALMPDQNESVFDLSAGGPEAPGAKALRPYERGFLYVDPLQFPTVFANGVDTETAQALAACQRPVAVAAFQEKLAGPPAWKALPSLYLMTRQDQMVPFAGQEFMAQRAGAKTYALDAGHAAMLTVPELIADQVMELALK